MNGTPAEAGEEYEGATMQKAQANKRKSGLTLRYKLSLLSTGLILIAVIALTVAFITMQRKQIKDQLLSRGKTAADLVGYNARYGVQIGDKPILDKILGGVEDDQDVVYCLIAEKSGRVITALDLENADLERIGACLSAPRDTVIEYRNKQGEDVINITIPVTLAAAPEGASGGNGLSDLEDEFFGGDLEEERAAPEAASSESAGAVERRVIGSVQMGITLSNMKEEIRKAILKTIWIGVAIFVVGVILAFWFGSIISLPIRRVVNLLNDISEGEGDLSQRIHLRSTDETGDLATGFNAFMDKFQEVKKISVFLNELADGGGDLTKRLEIPSQDEIGMLAKGFDRFTDKLHEIICQVADNTDQIAKASQAVSDTAIRLSRELNDMAGQASEVAGSSTQISNSIEKTNANVTDVNSLMNTTESVSGTGVEVVHEARNGMERISQTIRGASEVVTKLNESSQKIGEIITTITEIADQTKLISINAAIEASRVGAQGKGFAVVAEEIRRLATRVTKATTDISQRIKAIQEESLSVVRSMQTGMEQSHLGLELSGKSEEALGDISRYVKDTKARMSEIAVASNEQSSSIGIISKNINSISESARESSDGITQTARSMQDLNKEVQALKQLVGQFVLSR